MPRSNVARFKGLMGLEIKVSLTISAQQQYSVTQDIHILQSSFLTASSVRILSWSSTQPNDQKDTFVKQGDMVKICFDLWSFIFVFVFVFVWLILLVLLVKLFMLIRRMSGWEVVDKVFVPGALKWRQPVWPSWTKKYPASAQIFSSVNAFSKYFEEKARLKCSE